MKEQEQYFMNFRVTDLNEVKTLVEEWKVAVETITAQAPEKPGRASLPLTYDSVEINVDKERGPGQEVFLVFWAPLPMIDQFFKNLRQKGLNFTQEFDTEGPVIRCRMIPTASQP
jgi:hypothetical protein